MSQSVLVKLGQRRISALRELTEAEKPLTIQGVYFAMQDAYRRGGVSVSRSGANSALSDLVRDGYAEQVNVGEFPRRYVATAAGRALVETEEGDDGR